MYDTLDHPFIWFSKQRTGTGNALYFVMLSIIVMPSDRVWEKKDKLLVQKFLGGKCGKMF